MKKISISEYFLCLFVITFGFAKSQPMAVRPNIITFAIAKACLWQSALSWAVNYGRWVVLWHSNVRRKCRKSTNIKNKSGFSYPVWKKFPHFPPPVCLSTVQKKGSLVNIFDGYECFDLAVCKANAGKAGISKIVTVFADVLLKQQPLAGLRSKLHTAKK